MDLKQQALNLIAQECKTNLFFLCHDILGYDKMTEQTHQELCDFTTGALPNPPEISRSGFDVRKNLLLLLMPRGTFKSSIVTIGFTLQFLLNEPNARILIDSETFSKSKAFLREIIGHLENNVRYREIFRSVHGMYPFETKHKAKLWTDSELILPCRSQEKKEPTISCAGIDVTKNGMHYDLIIADDLHSEKNVTNKEQINQVIEHYKLAFSLLDPGKPMIVIGTRWDYNDLYQHIIDYESEDFNILMKSAYNDDGTLFFPEVLSEAELDKIKRRQGTYIFSCTPAGTPILMANWTYKNVEDIKIGDEVVGYERVEGGKTRLVPTRVLKTGKRRAQVQAVHTEDMVIRCTPDHEWYTGRQDETHRLYAPTHVGGKLLEVTSVLPEEQHDWVELGYLAGMIDGEGAVKYGSITITQSETHNPGVCRRIEEALEKLKFPYKKYETKPGQFQWVINGGKDSNIRLLNFANLGKKEQIVENLWKHTRRAAQKKHRVFDIQQLGKDDVYSFQTETGNYIAYGLMSKNCQYLNSPVSDETATFKRDYLIHKSWAEVQGRPMNWYLSVDPSYTDPRSSGVYSDYAGFILVGMDYMRELYVRHIVRKKMTYSQIIDEMFQIYTSPRFKDIKNMKILLEVIGTKSLSFELNAEQRRRNTWLPVQEIKTQLKNKDERIRGLAPYYENKHVYHIKECSQLEELEYELLHFPKAKHDDIIDPFATILEVASPPTNKLSQEDRSKPSKHRLLSYKPRSPITGY